jgi:hypothetical protein
MIGQILPNNNKKCYSNFLPTFHEVNTPSVNAPVRERIIQSPISDLSESQIVEAVNRLTNVTRSNKYGGLLGIPVLPPEELGLKGVYSTSHNIKRSSTQNLYHNAARRYSLKRRSHTSSSIICRPSLYVVARFSRLIIRIFQLIFLVEIIFFSHKKSVGTIPVHLNLSARFSQPFNNVFLSKQINISINHSTMLLHPTKHDELVFERKRTRPVYRWCWSCGLEREQNNKYCHFQLSKADDCFIGI